jgi:hypothetical protein
MENNTFYIVEYNDCYGNGDQKSNEVLVRNEQEFLRWLELRNKERADAGELIEDVEEFDLIPIELFDN